MELSNPFPASVRLRYLYVYACFKCGRSGLGLELHHIVGRGSASPLNACPLCPACHVSILHTHEVERDLFLLNYRFLWREHRYEVTDDDRTFLERHPWLLS